MNDRNFNRRMSEKSFEALLDCMKNDFAALKILDCDSKYKLTKSSSFSDLQTAYKDKNFLFRKSYQPGSCKNLIKKSTWEKICDVNSNTRQVKVSKVLSFDDDEPRRLLKKTILAIKIDFPEEVGISTKKMNHNEEKMLEYMEVEEYHSDKPLSPSLDQRRSSVFSIESIPSIPMISNESSTSFQSNLLRSSRSDITLLQSQEVKPDIFNVSKSFGQFTCGNIELSDSKKNLSIKKPETSNQDSASKQSNIKDKLEKKKKKLRPLMQEKQKKPIYTCSCWQVIFFLLLPVVVVLISTIVNQQQMDFKFCDPSFNFTNVTENLQKHVFGQTKAVTDLVKFLETDFINFKVIALVGGTGVGKSHVANIIKNSLSDNYYAFEYFPPLYNKVRQVYSDLSICRCNVIILENLRTEDILDAAFFTNALRNRSSDLCVWILALFNTQVTDSNLRRSMDLQGSVVNIENSFRKDGVEVKAIGFEPLREESITKCINEAIIESRLIVSEEDITQIKKSLLTANSGCKGAYSKVQLFGKIPNST